MVRLLNMNSGHPNPSNNSLFLSSILKGLKKGKRDKVTQKLPITPDVLKGILRFLNFSNQFDVTFWAACIVGFFSFSRKSNSFVPSLSKVDHSKHLCCFNNRGYSLSLVVKNHPISSTHPQNIIAAQNRVPILPLLPFS